MANKKKQIIQEVIIKINKEDLPILADYWKINRRKKQNVR